MTAATFEVLSGEAPGKTYRLEGREILVGRNPECGVLIDSNAVSRKHARILFDGNDFHLEDLGSRNGTFLNGERVHDSAVLFDKDEVRICDVTLLFRHSSGRPRPVAGVSRIDSNIPGGRNSDETRRLIDSEKEDTSTILNVLDAGRKSVMMVQVQPEAKLRAILEISDSIGKTLTPDRLFPRILEGLFTVFPQADRGMVLILDATGKLRPRAVKFRRVQSESTRYSKTIVQSALDDRKAILSADASQDERFSMSQSIAEFRIRSVMCVPLLGQEQRPLGVLQLESQAQTERFETDDLQILNSVAIQVSISLENALMHEEVLRQERIVRELRFAKEVQTAFLPKGLPKLPGYNFWAYYEAAGEVGGDFYDFLTLPDGRQAVVLADVAGKGIPAALLMAKASSETKLALISSMDNAGRSLELINNAICEAGLESKFITMVICIIDPKTNRMTIVNAGHMSPIIRRADGTIEEPATEVISGLPVGVLDGSEYESVEVELFSQDMVVLYSDGINEAMDAADREYTMDRLRTRILDRFATPRKLGEAILEDVQKHVAGQPQSDDMTMVLFHRE